MSAENDLLKSELNHITFRSNHVFQTIETQVAEFKDLLKQLDAMRFKIELEKVEKKTDV